MRAGTKLALGRSVLPACQRGDSMQQQKQQQSKTSTARKLVGRVKDEAKALKLKAKEKLQEQLGQEEEEEIDLVEQGRRSHQQLERFCQPGIGRSPCTVCHVDSSTCLLWRLKGNWSSQPQAQLAERQQARLLANAFNPMAELLQQLYAASATGGPLGFPANQGAYELMNVATEFLLDMCDNHLKPKLPQVFGGCTIRPVGGWAQETALACSKPCIDFVLSMPAWIMANRLCVCGYSGCVHTVAQSSGERLPFETQVHKALISSLERVVCGVAAAMLSSAEGRVRPDPTRGVACSPGTDSKRAWTPKQVKLRVVCRTDSGGERPCILRLQFGIPCLFAGQPVSSQAEEPPELFGHLLIGFSQPFMISLAMEEKKSLLSGAESSDSPRLRLVRVVKFVLKVGELLSVDKSEQDRPDEQLSFAINTAVRETQRVYEEAEGAYYGANFGDRVREILDALTDPGVVLPFFNADCAFADVRKSPLSPTTLRLVAFLHSERPPGVLLNKLFRYYEACESKPTGDRRQLATEIDAIISGPVS